MELMSNPREDQQPKGSFTRYHLPLIGYAVLVLVVSSLPNLKSPDVDGFAFDKVAHLGEYAVFAFLAVRSWRRLVRRRPEVWALAFTLVFALADEFHQKFIPGREFDPGDLLANAAGALVGLVLTLSIRRRSSRTTS